MQTNRTRSRETGGKSGSSSSSALKSSEIDPHRLIEGYGSLKGKLTLPHNIDWTKPVYAQVLRREKRDSAKRANKSSVA